MTKAHKEMQERLSREAQASTTHLGNLRTQHSIPDKDWDAIAEHHNNIIALGQQALDLAAGKKKPT